MSTTTEAADALDELVDTILDVAMEERRDEAAITIRDLIWKFDITAYRQSGL